MLSVVIPVHNVADFLPLCLDSVLFDRSAEVEVVAVDDCSPDRSAAILADYARRDPRLRVLTLPRNVGLSGARNLGLTSARGEYVWFVDGDDWVSSGAVEAVLDRLSATRPDVLLVDHVEVFDNGRVVAGTPDGVLRALPSPLRLAEHPRLLRLAQSACTKVARRAYLHETGLRFSPGWYEDCAFSHPLLMAAERIEVLDRVCYCYRQRAASGAITKTRSPRHFEVFAQYERLFARVDRGGRAYDVFRPELFRVMTDHYLVIAGNERRLPPSVRRSFFHRAARDYRRWLPADGYPMPDGVAGLKHRLLRDDNYPAYAVLRSAYRAANQLRRTVRRPAEHGYSPALHPAVTRPTTS
ncbi:glycosyl transferase family 2 [Micromonospora endolithica]|nr:glycosyl transferase family 2 [Micromonospora endolithica]